MSNAKDWEALGIVGGLCVGCSEPFLDCECGAIDWWDEDDEEDCEEGEMSPETMLRYEESERQYMDSVDDFDDY